MRLTRENNQNKNEKKKIHKNKSLIEEIHNIKYKLENQKLHDKPKKNNNNIIIEKQKEKIFKDGSVKFPSNSNIYKPSKKIKNKQNPKIQTELEKNSVYAKNKAIVMNTNKNINKGNNINIIKNNLNNENNNNIENNLKKDTINNNENIADFNIAKKSSIDNYNTYDNKINQDHMINDYKSRMNRVKEAMANVNKKIRVKNTSMDHRYSKFSNDIAMSDGDMMTDDDNLIIRRNHIYPHPYKFNSPTSIYNNTFNKQFNRNNGNILLNNNIKNKNGIYYYNKGYQNLEEKEDPLLYNNLFELNFPTNFNNEMINKNRNKYNSLINFNDYKTKLNFTNDIQSKTINGFYIHKSPLNTSKNINSNLITNKDTSNNDYIYTNYLNYVKKNSNINKTIKKRNHWHSMMEENELPLSPYKNHINTNNNYLENLDSFKSNRRSKNKITIVKKNNNNSIQEYNVSLVGDNDNDNDDYQKDFTISNNLKNKMTLNLENKYNINDNDNNNENLKMYYDKFSKNIQPITNDQFNISSTISKINITNDNYNNLSSCKKTRNDISNNKSNISNSKSYKNLINTPNFSDTGKTPKKLNIGNIQKIKPFEDIIENNNSNYNTNTISINEDNMVTKKKAKNDVPLPSTSGLKRNDSSSSNINKNLSKFVNNNYEICQNEKINFFGKEKDKNDNNNNKNDEQNKFVFETENDIIDYIFNKFEEERKKKNYFNRKLRFTGFVLSKKYKGKNLYDVRIEDDIDKINQQLKDDQILINEKQVEFRYIEDEKDNKNNDNTNIELNEEYKKLKLEIEKMNKKDIVKNELIKKLDKEKQNFLEEIEQLKNQINELKNNNINNNKLKDEENNINKKIDKIRVYNIENDKNMEEEKSYNYESDLNVRIKTNNKENNENMDNNNTNNKLIEIKNNKYNEEIYLNEEENNINKNNKEDIEDKKVNNLKCIESLFILNKDSKNKIMNKSVNIKNKSRIYNPNENNMTNKEEINKISEN